jgi:hypothetical protein
MILNVKIPVFVILLTFASCSNENIFNNIAQINYGTSFGECIGYCKHDMALKPELISYKCASWDTAIQAIEHSEKLDLSTWDSLKTNLNTKDFFDLPTTIGCPDCVDGGAEWVEILLNSGEVHKVTFEYNNEPVLLKNSVFKLRKLLGKNNCR